jgi:N-methylhydantoinase A
MAAAFLAEELGIREVLVPRFPGTFSAWGMLQTDLRHDLTESFFHASDSVAGDDLEAVLARLETLGRTAILAEGIDADRVSFQRSADMRYVGQEYTINVGLTSNDTMEIARSFHAAHERRYGHSSPDAPIEFVNLRVAAFGALNKFREPSSGAVADSPVLGERQVVFAGKRHATPVVARDRLPAVVAIDGPLVIEEQSATTVVPPGLRAARDPFGSILFTRQES